MIRGLALMVLLATSANARAEPLPQSLEGPWRFHLGDVDQGESPDLDDSRWVSMNVPGSWEGSEFESHYGHAWYRTTVRVEPGAASSILLPSPSHASTIYADGERIGGFGVMSPRIDGVSDELEVFEIPADATRDGAVVVAMHVVRLRGFSAPGGVLSDSGVAWIGPPKVIERYRDSLRYRRVAFWDLPVLYAFSGAALGVALIFVLVFFLRPRRDWAFLAVAQFLLLLSMQVVGFAMIRSGLLSSEWKRVAIPVTNLHWALQGLVPMAFFRLPRRLTHAVLGLQLLLFAVVCLRSWTSTWIAEAPVLSGLNGVLGLLFLLLGTAWAYRQRQLDARPMFFGLGAACLVFLASNILWALVGNSWSSRGPEHLIPLFGLLTIIGTFCYVLAKRFIRAVVELEDSHTKSRRFVPAAFLSLLGKNEVAEVERGEATSRVMTVLFADIRGFTRLSEGLGPRETFSFMNDYHAVMGPVIVAHDGFINQYYGDGIMALFPKADDAVEAAMEMRVALERFNAAREMRVEVGVGLHTGEVMLGTIGDDARLDTGVIGDAVNTASRIQELTKTHPPALLSESTLQALTRPVKTRYATTTTLAGRSEPTKLHAFGGALPDAAEMNAT